MFVLLDFYAMGLQFLQHLVHRGPFVFQVPLLKEIFVQEDLFHLPLNYFLPPNVVYVIKEKHALYLVLWLLMKSVTKVFFVVLVQ